MTIFERKMAKLVGVVHENEDDSGQSSSAKCMSRRQLPLTIENDLTMIMALDDACLACSSSTLYEVDDKTSNEINTSMQTFLRKYQALNRDEVTAALMVNFDDITDTLSKEILCVGCRRSVEGMLQKLHTSGDPALEPLVITEDKVISVSRDHITTPQVLANLFCNQLHRLKTTYLDIGSGPKNRKKVNNIRCNAHSLGLGSKKLLHFGHWTSTWKCMERECQEECVLIHFDRLRDTIDRYLKKHSFCDECTKMVNKAYTMLVEDEDPVWPDLPGACKAPVPVASPDASDDKKATKIYNGLTSCVSDHHVHVECNEEVVGHLIEMAEPELSGLRQERHAKTIEIAQKEVLTCIGICLYERFQKIQQRLREGQQSCDLLFYVALQSLKRSFEMAFESRQGVSDMEKLLAGFDEEERKKQEKAQKKREKKKKQKKVAEEKAAEEKLATPNSDTTLSAPEKVSPDALGDYTSTAVKEVPQIIPSINGTRGTEVDQKSSPPSPPTSQQSNHVTPLTVLKKLERKTCRTALQQDHGDFIIPNNRPMISIIKLDKMLEAIDTGEGNYNDDTDDEISQEEIQRFLSEVRPQRDELRQNLRQKFAELCANGHWFGHFCHKFTPASKFCIRCLFQQQHENLQKPLQLNDKRKRKHFNPKHFSEQGESEFTKYVNLKKHPKSTTT